MYVFARSADAIFSLWQAREYSDLTILTIDGDRHPVHRAIICPRSPLLEKLVHQQAGHEHGASEISLEQDDPAIVRLMLEYLYCLNYLPVLPSRSTSCASSYGHSSEEGSSTRTELLSLGNVYGTSAVSVFGGPPQQHGTMDLHSPFSTVFSSHARDRSESSLTVHAIPQHHDLSAFSGGPVMGRRQQNTPPRVRAPDPSPLATREPHLALHARVYAIAVKYGIAGLSALALDKFKIQLTRHWYASPSSLPSNQAPGPAR